MKFFGRVMKERFVMVETMTEDFETGKPLVDRLEN